MARRSKGLPARRARDDEALLIRSAESLGRIIGSLQRQLDEAGERFRRADSMTRRNGDQGGRTRASVSAGAPKPSKTAASKAKRKGRGASGSSKVQPAADHTSKRAAKSAAAKKTAGRRSGSRTAARKATRGS